MKIKHFLIIPSLAIILNFCNSFNPVSESWEGISDDILKVTISEFFPFEENTTNDNIKFQLIERLNQRASLLIACQITINISKDKISKDSDAVLNNLINEIITNGKLVNFECSENNYCSAHGEYNIAELNKNLEIINSR